MPDAPEIDVTLAHDTWGKAIKDTTALSLRAARAAAYAIDEPQKGELSIVYFDDAQVQQLNREHRGKDTPTNVLSFPSDGLNPHMGDIVLAYGTIVREASDKGISLADHVTHLLVHGYLHLCGYDHTIDEDALVMEALEIKALASLGIANPYESWPENMEPK